MGMLKKQTVWLLTMLSLMIVLSVYYLISDKEDLAYMETEGLPTEEDAVTGEEVEVDDVDVNQVEEISQNELFAMIRMEMEDERNMQKDRLKDIVASSNATTSEINEAMDEMNTIESTSTKENILQETILATDEGYHDVLVRAEEDKVHVHVMTDKLEKKAALSIMQTVKDELGEIPVDVNYQGTTD